VAEFAEQAEGEFAGVPGDTSPGLEAAMELAIARRRGKAKAKSDDPELDSFLRGQSRLAELQAEHLHEQRGLIISRLRWGRFGDRMRALLQVMTAFAGAAVVALVTAMAWEAHEAHGLAIEAFSVPPDLARTGLTGQVAASRFLDKLQVLQTATAQSDRPSQSYSSDWGADFKVEIPQTGLTLSEFEKLLRERLGHVSHVTGEVVTTPTGITLTARMGDAPPKTFTGPISAFDDLTRQAAEAVYRDSQPYRYAEYLENDGRWDEAFKVISDLATNGRPVERGWAYAKWAVMDITDHGDAPAALRHAALGRSPGRGSDINDQIAIVNTAVWTGHEEADLAWSKALATDAQKRLPDTSEVFYTSNKLLARAWLSYLEADYRGSSAWWTRTSAETDFGGGALGPLMAATTDALGHDLPAARTAIVLATEATESELAWHIAIGAFPALPRYWMFAEQGQWDKALADVRAFDAVLEAEKVKRPVYGLMQQVLGWPLEALALARTGDVAGAQALIGKTPLDCYPCLRVRGQIAAEARDWPAAERWFAEAVHQAPSPPLAYAEWGRMRLDKGDLDGAIAVLRTAEARGPRFADPPQIWGEALMAKGDFAGAQRKFAEAARLAPTWGRNHLKAGEALTRLGRVEAARKELRTASALDLTPAERLELAAAQHL
jgi:tetratricopeptide (TPR) repeat protein